MTVRGGWLGDHAPNAIWQRKLQIYLDREATMGNVQQFISDAIGIITIYRARQIEPYTTTEQRSAKRYLLALAAGKTPSAQPPPYLVELIRSHTVGYNGDMKRVAESLLNTMQLKTRGRPQASLDNWLMATIENSYRQHFNASTKKNSRFLNRVLPLIMQAAGRRIQNINITRLETAISQWKTIG